jgi:hypothetical protein
VIGGKLRIAYNYLAREMFRIDVEDKLPEGDLTTLYDFEVTGKAEPRKGNGTTATGSPYVRPVSSALSACAETVRPV